MLYVLKFVGNGPDNFLECFYDEVASIKNRIALVKFEHNKNQLLGRQFELIGNIEKEEDLPELFKDKTVEVQTVTKLVPLKDILEPPAVEGSQKSWYENLE